MESTHLTASERELILLAETEKQKAQPALSFYIIGMVFVAWYLGSSLTAFLAHGRQHFFEFFGSTAIVVCFFGLLYEHTKFQKRALSLIQKLSTAQEDV